jgi:iron(III) transport system substrate-binding protein
LTDHRWKGKVSLAYPLFGTTATHAAALFAYWGDEKAKAYYRALKDNGVLIVDGNATSKDAVARGEVPVGFTDTDDAEVALRQGKPVGIVYPDQGEERMGTLVIPNTVALIRNCPHPEAGKKLIDFLLSRDVEEMLAGSGSAQMPVRPGIPVPEGNPSLAGIKAMKVDWSAVEAKLVDVSRFLEELFVR